jgi:glycosyltransferase involved in cell wall biosynthesis
MILSILMASFKRASLLRVGLQSIDNQKIKYPFEIIVVNDGLQDDTEAVCKEFPHLDIKYYFSGQRNTPNIIWRCPGFALNIAAQKATGNYILLTSPELYYLTPNCLNMMIETTIANPRSFVIPEIGYDDMKGMVSEKIINGEVLDFTKRVITSLNLQLPFCLMLKRNEFISIGGYDEDFIGYCHDDNDIINRLKLNGVNQYYKVPGAVIHLFHGHRMKREGLIDRSSQFEYNSNLLETKKHIICRNTDKAWGVLDV